MSCRHDLALGTCKRCYPATGTIEPGPEEDYGPNLEGPGAIVATPTRTTPDGGTLRVLGDPPVEPVLQIFKDGNPCRVVLLADDRAWLREQLARFDPAIVDVSVLHKRLVQFDPAPEPQDPGCRMPAVLAKLAAIADVFEDNGLDEARPEWAGIGHGGSEPEAVILLEGRGGKTLLTLADAFTAREALRAASAPALDADDDVPIGPVLSDPYYFTHGPIERATVEIRFRSSWRLRSVQASTADGFAVEGITGWFRNSDEGKSWRWPQRTVAP